MPEEHLLAATTEPHCWLPVTDDGRMVRHAFRGRRWEFQPRDESICGRALPMATPSEMDWIAAESCCHCNSRLKGEQA